MSARSWVFAPALHLSNRTYDGWCSICVLDYGQETHVFCFFESVQLKLTMGNGALCDAVLDALLRAYDFLSMSPDACIELEFHVADSTRTDSSRNLSAAEYDRLLAAVRHASGFAGDSRQTFHRLEDFYFADPDDPGVSIRHRNVFYFSDSAPTSERIYKRRLHYVDLPIGRLRLSEERQVTKALPAAVKTQHVCVQQRQMYAIPIQSDGLTIRADMSHSWDGETEGAAMEREQLQPGSCVRTLELELVGLKRDSAWFAPGRFAERARQVAAAIAAVMCYDPLSPPPAPNI